MTTTLRQGLGQATGGMWKDYAIYSADDNKWQQISDMIGQKLSLIQTGSGYMTDLGNNIFVNRPTPLELSELPGLVYMVETIEPYAEGGVIGKHTWLMNVNAQVITYGNDCKRQLNNAVIDVLRILRDNWQWGGVADSTWQPTITPHPADQAEFKFASATISFQILYCSDLWSA